MFKIKKNIIAIITFAFLLLSSGFAYAQIEDWQILLPNSGAFEARFPRSYTTKETALRIDDETVMYMSEYNANIKENGHEKTYTIKLEQKMGKPLTTNMIAFALKTDTDRYLKLAESLKGKLVTQNEITYGPFSGKDMFITYNKDKKKMGIRIRILFTDVSRIYMVSNGLADSSYTYRANNFFETIKLYDNLLKKPGKFNDDWVNQVSPKNIFTFKSPPENSPYLEQTAKVASSDKGESVEFVLIDPILKYKTNYLIKSYILDTAVNEEVVMQTFIRDNISKFVENPSRDTIDFDRVKGLGYDILTSNARVPPTVTNPHTNYIMLEAHYKGNILVVQEVSGADDHVLSPGISIINGFTFHPKNFAGFRDNQSDRVLGGSTKDDKDSKDSKNDKTKKQAAPKPEEKSQ